MKDKARDDAGQDMDRPVIGIDLGGTWLRGARVSKGIIAAIQARPVNSRATSEEMLENLCGLIDELLQENIRAIGIGIPGLVDTRLGMIYDVFNIPCWKELALRTRLEERYRLPVFLDNDA